MSEAPLVYLDTQDFIRFRNNIDDRSVASQYDELKRLRLSGQIRLGYSALQIWEFITPVKEERFVADRTERGELVVDLCGRNAFPFYSDLANGASYPNNGFWMPNGLLRQALDFDALLEDRFNSFFAERGLVLNRKNRRKIKSPAFLKAFIEGKPKSNWPSTGSSDGNPMLGLVLGKYFEGFILGKVSKQALNNKLLGWASDPRSFGALWHEFGDGVNALDEYVYKHLLKIIDSIDGAIIELDRLQALSENMATERAEIAKELIKTGFDKKTVSSILPAVPDIPKALSVDGMGDVKDILGPGRLDHILHYVNKRLTRVGRTQRNDVVDMMHMLYAYDCDYFRCDRAMYNLFSDYAPFSGKLVVSIPDLLDRVSRHPRQGSREA